MTEVSYDRVLGRIEGKLDQILSSQTRLSGDLESLRVKEQADVDALRAEAKSDRAKVYGISAAAGALGAALATVIQFLRINVGLSS